MQENRNAISEMKREYGEYFFETSDVTFDIADVPENLRHLAPYARFWGVSDDLIRERLASNAPDSIKRSLKELIASNEDALDDWLAGDESFSNDPSNAYIAYSAMRLCADYF